jgi:hypothetical protein
MHERKQFNQALHDKNDPRARQSVTDWVALRWGLVCKPNPDKYGVDLIAYKKDQMRGYIEVETRVWDKTDKCPYQSIHIAERKEKLFSNKHTVIFVTTHNAECAYWCNAEEVLGSPLIEVPNKYVQKNEFFYDVPIEIFRHVILDVPF